MEFCVILAVASCSWQLSRDGNQVLKAGGHCTLCFLWQKTFHQIAQETMCSANCSVRPLLTFTVHYCGTIRHSNLKFMQSAQVLPKKKLFNSTFEFKQKGVVCMTFCRIQRRIQQCWILPPRTAVCQGEQGYPAQWRSGWTQEKGLWLGGELGWEGAGEAVSTSGFM